MVKEGNTMTREEAIEIFEQKGWWIAQKETLTSKQAEEIVKLNDAVDFALSALRPISREQVERMFPGCPYCDIAKANSNIYNKALWIKEAETRKWTLAGKSLQYCPICGRPLTDEAVEMVMERLEKLKNEIG